MYSITNNVTVDGRTLLAHTKVVDANNHVTGQFSNSLGQLVLVREYSGTYPNPSASADTRYTYDAAGNLTAVRQSNWNNSQPATFLSETGMTYDGFGRKISMNDPDMGNWTYAYNAAGSLTEQRDANLARLCFYYDELDRLTNKRHDNNNDGCGTGDTRLAYYAYYGSGAGKVGKPSEIRWGSSDTQNRETFDYDSLGRLITHNRWVDSRQYTMSYSGFDALHRPGTRVLTWPNGNTHTTSVTYDHEGENTLVGGGSTLVTAVGYNDMGQLKRIALNNGLSTWYGYSGYETSGNNDAYDMKEVTWNWGTNRSFGKLWRICTAAHANTRCQAAEKDLSVNGQVLDMRHSYDNVGNVAAVRDYVNANQLQTFGYDHLNRLTSAGTNSAGSGQYTHTYAYNTLGNITSYNGATYTYGSSLHKHAVTAANGVSYSYDANGNMTLRDAAGTVNDYTQNFNVENELASVVNNGSTTNFTYDANGIRTKTVAPSGVTTYYPFPGYEEEVNGSTITRRITYSIAGQAVALRVQIVSGSNTLYYLHTDHLGSTSLATTTGGAVVAGSTARYYPFGDWRTEPTAGLTDRGFTGHLHNNIGNAPDDIGLVYMNARWYLPYINRFVSADSIVPDPANPQSFNRYSYVLNRPLSFTDPTGHRECNTETLDCGNPVPHISGFREALLQAWAYYKANFALPFEGTQSINQGFGPGHDGVDYDGEFTVRAPASGVVVQDRFRNPPAGMWMVQNTTTREIRTWSRWRTDPGWQGELLESNRGDDGLLEPERLLRTGEWEDIRPNWSHSPGTMIKVDHGLGLATTYIHTVPALTVGQEVKQGDILGTTANNGWSSGIHLHYRLEFTYGGRTIYLNPQAPPRQIAGLLP